VSVKFSYFTPSPPPLQPSGFVEDIERVLKFVHHFHPPFSVRLELAVDALHGQVPRVFQGFLNEILAISYTAL
jgi:hypothetical protein